VSLGFGELLLILLVALLVLGPDRLPGAARTLGRTLRALRSVLRDFEAAVHTPAEAAAEPKRTRPAADGAPSDAAAGDRTAGEADAAPSGETTAPESDP